MSINSELSRFPASALAVNQLVKSGDAPRWGPPSSWTRAVSAGSFVTYAMFLPVGGDSRWVPVASLSWSYRVDATLSPFTNLGTGGGVVTPGTTPVTPHSTWRDETFEPRWDHVQDAADIVRAAP